MAFPAIMAYDVLANGGIGSALKFGIEADSIPIAHQIYFGLTGPSLTAEPGTGALQIANSQISWRAPGSSHFGSAVTLPTIDPGQITLLDGDNPALFLVLVTHRAASWAGISETIPVVTRWKHTLARAYQGGGMSDTRFNRIALKNISGSAVGPIKVYLTQGVPDVVITDATGNDAFVADIAGSLAEWPLAGYAKCMATGEVFYYTGRDDDRISVAARHRRQQTWVAPAPAAGTIRKWPPIALALEAPVSGAVQVWDDTLFAAAPPIKAPFGVPQEWLAFKQPMSAAEAVTDGIVIPTIAAGAFYGLWAKFAMPYDPLPTPYTREMDNAERYDIVLDY